MANTPTNIVNRLIDSLQHTHPVYWAVGLTCLIAPYLLFTRAASSQQQEEIPSPKQIARMEEPHTVVVLGASLAGLPITHYLMKHIAPKKKNLRVILVSPNTDFLWNLATVRGVLPDLIPQEKYFFPIAPTFEKYPAASRFEFIVGKAEALDPTGQVVNVGVNGGGSREVKYDTLIIATGASDRNGMPFKNLNTSEETRASITKLQQEIKAAKTVVVAGAGHTGSEVVGELGQEYASTKEKEVILIANDTLPLDPSALNSVRQTVKTSLEKLGVRIISSSRVTSITKSATGRTVLEVTKTDGSKQTIETDVYIPAFGMVPNSQFAPEHMLDSAKRFKQTKSLKVEGYDNIFVLGDVGNLQAQSAKSADDQVIHLRKIMEAYFTGKSLPLYNPDTGIIFAVSLGRKGGSGQAMGFKLFSILVWYLKGRYLGTNYAGEVAAGNRTMQATKW